MSDKEQDQQTTTEIRWTQTGETSKEPERVARDRTNTRNGMHETGTTQGIAPKGY